jgi:hypothetical protein
MTLLSRGSSGLEGSPAEGFRPIAGRYGPTTLFQQIDALTLPACVGGRGIGWEQAREIMTVADFISGSGPIWRCPEEC